MIDVELGPQESIGAIQFRGFYSELLEIRDTIAPADPAASSVVSSIGVDALRTRLAQQIADLGYRHDLVGTVPVDTGYVLTAVADEVILVQCRRWAHYEAWADRPLEAVLYGTRIAGDRVFAAADELVRLQRSERRAATVILLALLTGFRGRYQGWEDPLAPPGARNDHPRIIELERALYELVCHRPYAPEDPAPYATPDLLATTLEGRSVRRLPSLWPWLIATVALATAYLPFSHLVWSEQVHDIDEDARAILAYHHSQRPADGD